MNSCLYRCRVMHHRLEPVTNRFFYDIFMFGLDLAELDEISQNFTLISRNRFNLFNFRDRDHLRSPGKSIKETIVEFARSHGYAGEVGRVFLITHLNTWGYTFNPVSFYFIFDTQGQPACAVTEINNTFGEMKPFFVEREYLRDTTFMKTMTKYFYVSPFIEMDTSFHFELSVPGDRMLIRINDYRDGKKFFLSTLSGNRVPLSDRMLLWYSIRFPAITLRIIWLIHWQALKLWLRGLPYFKKTDQLELQREVYHG